MSNQFDQLVSEPTVRRILFFDEMLTPKLIQIGYWLGLALIVWNGLGNLFHSGFFGIFEAIAWALMSIIALRVVTELVMLLFKLHDTMQVIARNTETPLATPAAAEEKNATKASTAKPVRKTKKKLAKKTTKKPSE